MTEIVSLIKDLNLTKTGPGVLSCYESRGSGVLGGGGKEGEGRLTRSFLKIMLLDTEIMLLRF